MGLILGILVCVITFPVTFIVGIAGPGANFNTGRGSAGAAFVTFLVGEFVGVVLIVSHYLPHW